MHGEHDPPAGAASAGVVLATDRRASLGGRFVSNKRTVKLEQVHPTAAITLSGSVGGAQAYARQLRAQARLYETRRGDPMGMDALATAAGNALRGLPASPLLGGVDAEGPRLFQLDAGGGVLEDEYGATGSGTQVAVGAIEGRYDPDAGVDAAAGLAADAVAAASERDTASGNGLVVARITAEGVDLRTPEGVALAATGRTRSPLQVPESVEKIHEADAHVGIGTAGHAADGRRLVDVARQEAQVERLRYDQPVGVETLAKAVTDHVQEYTQTGGARPYGAALLMGGVDGGPGGTPRLFETDPSGTPYEWRAVAIGGDSGEIRDYLEAEHEPDLSLDSGVDLALSALSEPNGDTLDPEGASAATIPVETGRYERINATALRERIEALGLDTAS